MTLSPGTRLGRYEIAAPLGAGGMGHVYRAIDTQLHRHVAVKVIADRFEDRADLRERFRVEAMAVAALNHPNICQVYDAGTEAGIDFIVMELVDGETLMARTSRGPIALDQAMRICRELAGALAAAHRAGVVHRDVKPLNVMLTKAGTKLMDFGLARISRPVPAFNTTESTVTPKNLTDPGSALGTWQYMSPEQVRGERSDARSDVFAFGAVMFEVVSGRPAFSGASTFELVRAILESEAPPLQSVTAGVPDAVGNIVRTCLHKDANDRWQTAGDVARALDVVSDADRLTAVPSRSSRYAAAAVAGIAIGATAMIGLPRSTGPAGLDHTVRAQVQVGPEYLPTADDTVALSGDGRTIFYEGGPGAPNGNVAIYRRDLNVAGATRVMGTDGGQTPSLSPDGQWLAFRRGSTLAKVPVVGGAPTDLATFPTGDFWGISWGDDGTIVIGSAKGLWSVPASGGVATSMTSSSDDGDVSHAWPQVLPGSRALLFALTPGPTPDSRVVVLDRRSGERKDLLRGVAAARYVATGHLAYVKDDALWTVPFDLDRLSIDGEAVQLAQGVMEDIDGAPLFSFSAHGDVVFIAGTKDALNTRTAWIGLDGRVEFIETPPGRYEQPQVSPDGSRISLTLRSGRSDVWTYDVARQLWSRSTPGRYQVGAWSPDGSEQVFFTSHGIVRRKTDGTGTETTILPDLIVPFKWSPRGDSVLVQYAKSGQADLYSIDLASKTQRPTVATAASESLGSYSPDGRWVVFSALDTGRSEIFIQSVDGGERHQVTSTGSIQAIWGRDGRHIYYRSRAAMWAIPVVTTPKVSIGTPQKLFEQPNPGGNQLFGGTFDMMPDGKRFVMTTVPTSRFYTLGLILNAVPPTNR